MDTHGFGNQEMRSVRFGTKEESAGTLCCGLIIRMILLKDDLIHVQIINYMN